MRRNGHKTTSGVKFNTKFDFSVPDFLCREILEIGPRFHVFSANFLLRMRKNGWISTSGQIINPKFEIPMGCFLLEYEFWWGFRQDLYVF